MTSILIVGANTSRLLAVDFADIERRYITAVVEAIRRERPELLIINHAEATPEEAARIAYNFMRELGWYKPITLAASRGDPDTMAERMKRYADDIEVRAEVRDVVFHEQAEARQLQRERYKPKNKRFRLPPGAKVRNSRWRG